MAAKAIYSVVAAVGIAAASAAAWWFQHWQHKAPVPGSSESAPAQRRARQPPDASNVAVLGNADGVARNAERRPAAVAKPAPAPAVEVARVERTRLVDSAQAVGSLRSRQSVMLRPEVSARVAKINFQDGEKVRKGQLLVQFDDQLPRAQVQQAEAELSIARANHKRNTDLVAQNFISKSALDQSAANLDIARAKLSLAKATADRLRIVAPFDGIAGIRNINVGDYLKDGADIVNIEDIDALLVDFRLPERFQAKVRLGQLARVATDVVPGQTFEARVSAIDPLIDANGRSVALRGCIDNRARQLRPGMFVRVTTVFGERDAALVVPEEAIVPQGGRQFVLQVEGAPGGERTSRKVEVKVGLREPGRVEITDGLADGDTVVTAGQQRIQRDGTVVRVIEMAPADDANAAGSSGRSAGHRALGAAGTDAADARANGSATGVAPGQRSTASDGGREKAATAVASRSGPNPCAPVAAQVGPASRGSVADPAPAPAPAPAPTPRRAS